LYLPFKYPSFWAVLKSFLDSFLSYNLDRHWLTPNKSVLDGRVFALPCRQLYHTVRF
jgi:hypothetical protein